MKLSERTAAESASGAAERLLQFNRQLIDQALELVAAHDANDALPYEQYMGPHLRHVIEHYEALLMRDVANIVDYDQRPRERELERDAALARSRLIALQQRLAGWPDATLEESIVVHGRAGLSGDFEFAIRSSIGRELVFLASHATHHYALLQGYCAQHGIATDANFGRAPATVAHARAADMHSPSLASS